jgi:uncharacterized protein YjiS (DUF1127 family)
MTRLELSVRSDARVGFGPWFSTVVALTSPVQGMLGRPSYGDVPPLALRPRSRMLATLLRWHQRARQRRQLGELNDHLLRDIGITRAEALAEAEQPFWRG